MKKENHVLRIIGIILIVVAVLMFLFITLSDNWMDFGTHFKLMRILGPVYAIVMIGGIALVLGDFFKWRGKKFQQGMYEAQQEMMYNQQQTGTRFCPHCGKPQTQNTPFCPYCGNKLLRKNVLRLILPQAKLLVF